MSESVSEQHNKRVRRLTLNARYGDEFLYVSYQADETRKVLGVRELGMLNDERIDGSEDGQRKLLESGCRDMGWKKVLKQDLRHFFHY